MKNVKLLDLRDSLKLQFKVLSIFGMWKPETVNGSIYTIFSILMVGIPYVAYTTSEMINIALSFDDLTKLTDASFLFLTHFAQIPKIYYFTVNYDRILNLLNSLNRDIFLPRNERQTKILANEMKFSVFYYKMFISMCVATVTLWCIFPLIDKKETMELPLSAWYPFSTDSSPVFEIIFIYQIIAVMIDGLTNVTLDMVTSGFMGHICGQLDHLNDALLHIREQAIANLGKNDPKIIKNENCAIFKNVLQKEMDKEIIRCVVHHINIIE